MRTPLGVRCNVSAVLITSLLASCGGAASHVPATMAAREIEPVIDQVRQSSFPQLRSVAINVYELRSRFDYLQARFTVSSYFSRQLQYMVLFNPEAIRRHVPNEALRGIVAHELAHIDYYESQSRMGLLSLAGLLLPDYTTRFERRADLEAIARGYGKGLALYRTWLYRNIPSSGMAEKKRDYYSPQEIAALLEAEHARPGTMAQFLRCVPRNLDQIREEARTPGAACSD